jgi:2-keto-4-pentenoate hydratase
MVCAGGRQWPPRLQTWEDPMTDVDAIAARLVQARRTAVPQPALVPDDAAGAYAVQERVAQALGWFDGVPRHWKSGGPSRSAELTHAALPASGVWPSPADVSAWPFRLRGIEAEIALRLRQPVDAPAAAALDVDAARAFVDAMCVSIEIVDSRWTEGLDAPPLARLADLQSHGGLVLGEWVPFVARDWAAQALSVRIGGAEHGFAGTHALADPAWVLPAWLRHATRNGATLPAGTVVTTGTWCGVLFGRPGDEVVAAFDGVGQARLTL